MLLCCSLVNIWCFMSVVNTVLFDSFKENMKNELEPYLESLGDIRPDFVGYRNFRNDGYSLLYCTNERWELNNIGQKEIALHYAKEILLTSRQGFKMIVRSPSATDSLFLKSLLIMDMCNSILIYQKEKEIIHMFCFIFRSSNKGAMNLFVNKREEFELVANKCLRVSSNIACDPRYSPLYEVLFSKQSVRNIFEMSSEFNTGSDNASFTKRQSECFDLLRLGATDKEISKTLGICIKTVEHHLKKVKEALGCHSRFEIIKKINQQKENIS